MTKRHYSSRHFQSASHPPTTSKSPSLIASFKTPSFIATHLTPSFIASLKEKLNLETSVENVKRIVTQFLALAQSSLNGKYVAIFTVFLMVILSFMLPDISQKIHRANELKTMKEVVDFISKEVSRAEVACLTAANQLCSLQCSMHDGETETMKNYHGLSICSSSIHVSKSEPSPNKNDNYAVRHFFFPRKNISYKEITIMSYLYTDSFDGNDDSNDAEVSSNNT